MSEIPEKTKLNVLMVSNNYKPYSGGLVSALDTYMDSLKHLGCNVNLVTLDFSYKKEDEAFVSRAFCPIKFVYKKNFISVPFFSTYFLKKIIEDKAPDVIHVHHPFLLGQSALKLAKRYNIPIVFTYHTLYEKYLHYVPLPEFFTKPLIRYYVRNFCKKVDLIIAPTLSVKNLLLANGTQNAIEVIATGINKDYLNTNFSYKTKSENLFKLLTVSRFSKEKNLYFLLDFFQKLDQQKFCFKLIGFGPEFENLKSYAYDKLQLSVQNIQFVEKPEKKEILKSYQEADLFIFASKTETQGLVLAESMVNGTPVVALNGSAISDIVIHGENGFICTSVDEMFNYVNNIAHNDVLHKTLQLNAWKTGTAFWPESCAKKLMQCYEKVITRSKER